MERRDFLKLSATASAVGIVSGCDSESVNVTPPDVSVPQNEQVNWSACLCNCGNNCPLKVVSVDGKIVRVESEAYGDDVFPENRHARPCPRGRSNRQRVYNPDRVLNPMKRVGPRGFQDSFEEISWEQAISEIGSKLNQIYETHGARSVYMQYQSGAYYELNGTASWTRLLGLKGGYLGRYGSYSSAQQGWIVPKVFGGSYRSTVAEMEHSDYLLFFGYNPLEIRHGGSGEGYEFDHYRQGKKTVIIDCRFNDSNMGREIEYHPCRPGTDAALAQGIAYHLIANNLTDDAFLADKCYGYDAEPESIHPKDGRVVPAVSYEHSYKAFILGDGGDGTAKTPEWAEAICGVPAANIKAIAEELASKSAPFIVAGYGLNRQMTGEDNCRAVGMLALLVGAVGKRGTNVGMYMPNSKPPVAVPSLPGVGNQEKASISCFTWTQAIVDGENMSMLRDGVRLPADEQQDVTVNGIPTKDGKLGRNIKAIINFAGNTLINQHSDCNKTHEILSDESKCELIVVSENHWTPSARYADYLLPDSTWLETDDFCDQSYSAGAQTVITAMTKAIEPLGQCRSSWEVCADLADAMGVGAEFRDGHEDYASLLQWFYDNKVKTLDTMFPATLEEAQKQGVFKKYVANPVDDIAAAKRNCGMFDYVQNGGVLNTSSGKIDIFSHELDKMEKTWEIPSYWKANEPYVCAVPKYSNHPEGFQDDFTPGIEQFPLQLIGHHTKGRTHSSYHSVAWLREAVHDAVWINPVDANLYGVQDGDKVIVESLRGKILIDARVTNRIMPGVLSVCQGAWYQPENGVDIGGCVNTLTSQDFCSPYTKGNPQHSNRVRIYRA